MLSRYHQLVLCIYFLLLLTIVFIFPELLVYSFSINRSVLVTLFGTSILFSVYIYFFQRRKQFKREVNISNMALAFGYGFAFAIPEEILFRGIIQGILLSSIFPCIAILIASLLFGAAHIFNGAQSFNPRDWNWGLVLLVFTGGIPLGFLYYSTGSLLFPTLFHAIILVMFQLFLPIIDKTKAIS